MLQGDAVDTIAQTGGVGAVRKDMPKMSLALGAAYFGPAREERTILMLAHRFALGRSIEARPTEVPESYLASELKSGAPQQIQRYIPSRFSCA